jgi:hypothetical protein
MTALKMRAWSQFFELRDHGQDESVCRFELSETERAPARYERCSSLFSFKNNITKTTQAFNLQYERVGRLENVEG